MAAPRVVPAPLAVPDMAASSTQPGLGHDPGHHRKRGDGERYADESDLDRRAGTAGEQSIVAVEQRGDQNAGQHLADDRWLAQPAEGMAQQPAHDRDRGDLQEYRARHGEASTGFSCGDCECDHLRRTRCAARQHALLTTKEGCEPPLVMASPTDPTLAEDT
jgi:hypothetical protein